jgi:hypothetical protein
MRHFLWGLAVAGALLAAVAFVNFWRRTRDRLFLLFALAFTILGGQWVLLTAIEQKEQAPQHFVVRVVAFLLIAAAIVDKNRRP